MLACVSIPLPTVPQMQLGSLISSLFCMRAVEFLRTTDETYLLMPNALAESNVPVTQCNAKPCYLLWGHFKLGKVL